MEKLVVKEERDQLAELSKTKFLSVANILEIALRRRNFTALKIYDRKKIHKAATAPASGGWVTTIGKCEKLYVDLFYDFTATGTTESFWFGFYSPKKADLDVIAAEYGTKNYTTLKRLSYSYKGPYGYLKHPPSSKELKNPIFEAHKKEGEYYFGIHDFTSSGAESKSDGASFDIERAVKFVEQCVSSEKRFINGTPEKILAEINDRRGQPKFRKLLFKLYNGRCAVTGSKITQILEAAHIQPFSEVAEDKPSNGILMRSDIHTLFDLGLIWIDDTYRVRVSTKAQSEYAHLDQKPLTLPKVKSAAPSRPALRDHARRFNTHK